MTSVLAAQGKSISSVMVSYNNPVLVVKPEPLNITPPQVTVAVGVIIDDQSRVLVALRPQDKEYSDYWEFPGGKLEAGETSLQALARELEEEVGITPLVATPLIQLTHDYPGKTVLLEVWHVSHFQGEPRGCEGQQLQWVARGELMSLRLLPANGVIVEAILKL